MSEWLDLMLEEIARKQREADEANEEKRLREEDGEKKRSKSKSRPETP